MYLRFIFLIFSFLFATMTPQLIADQRKRHVIAAQQKGRAKDTKILPAMTSFAKMVKKYLGVQEVKKRINQDKEVKQWKQFTSQMLLAANIYSQISDPKQQKDVRFYTDQAFNLISLASWVAGSSVPHLWIPAGIYAVYKIPPVTSTVDEKIYGKYLVDDQDYFEENEFNDSSLTNSPYLICNYYQSSTDIEKGANPLLWTYVTKEDIEYVSDDDGVENPGFYKTYARDKFTSFFNKTDSATEKNYFTVPGRWLKVQSGYWDHTVRFSTLNNPYALQLICSSIFLKNKIIKNPEDLNLVVPQVGYSDVTLSYPIYYYVRSTIKTQDGVHHKVVKRIEVENQKNQKLQSESKDYIDSLIRSTNTARLLHSTFDAKKNQWVSDLHGGVWDVVGEIDTAYELYTNLRQSFVDGNEIPPTKKLELGMKVASSGETIFKVLSGGSSVPGLIYLDQIRASYYLFQGIWPLVSYTPPIDSLINDYYTFYIPDSSKQDLSEFDESKISRANLLCLYFENEEGLKANKPVYWNWAPAHALGEPEDKIGSYSEIYNSNISLLGRWVESKNNDTKNVYFFATLEDPVRLMNTCYVSLNHQVFNKKIKREKVGLALAAVGTYTKTYPIIYFIPEQASELEGKPGDNAILFTPDFQVLNKRVDQQIDNFKEQEEEALNNLDSPTIQDTKQIIMFDAGSSGTRVYIYEWAWPKDQKLPTINVSSNDSLDWVKKIDGGVHKMIRPEGTIDDVATYLKPLVEFLKEHLHDAKQIPTYFLATGGIRSLPAEQGNKILQLIKAQLNTDPLFDVKEVNAISGQWEGVYSWLTVNSLLKNFDYGKKTTGMIEMGGASLQVVFEPKEISEREKITLPIAGKTYSIYSHVYEGLGINSARAIGSKIKECYADKPNLENFELCIIGIRENLVKNLDCQDHCGLQRAYQPPLNGSFVGISGLPYILDQYHIKLDNTTIAEKAEELCAQPLSHENNDEHEKHACFDVAYISELLTGGSVTLNGTTSFSNGLGFVKNKHQIDGVFEINGVEPSWTYGKILHTLLVTLGL